MMHSDTPFFSFAIPVYNAVTTLSRTVESVLSQSFTDWEMILIDDGSSDGSAALCLSLAASDPRVRFVSRPNGGAATARNQALSLARGSYVWFVDADDRLAPDSLSGFADTLVRVGFPDLLTFSWCRECQGVPLSETLYSDAVSDPLTLLADPACSFFVWNKLYRRAFLSERALRFEEGISTIEDWLFNALFLASSPSVYTASALGYCYEVGNPLSTQSNPDPAHRYRQAADSALVHARLKAFLDTCADAPFHRPLTLHLGRSVAGFLYSLYRYGFPDSFLVSAISRYRALGLYPVPPALGARARLFRVLASRPYLFRAGCALRRVLTGVSITVPSE